jgi:octaprenyl-diphosphate synthase
VTLAGLQAPVRAELERVQKELRRVIEADFQLIREVNAHLLQMQGKLFRPTIMLLADQATGGPTARSVTVAAVVELMGDYLSSRAVIELVRLDEFETLRVLSRVTNEMTVGEMRQLLAHDPLKFTEEQYDLLIRAKTASLLSGAAEVGALAAPPVERAALRRFGEALGMAFQIVDDLLDYTADAAVMGKPSGSDLREHKVTLPLIYALPRMAEPERRAVAGLLRSVEPGDEQIAEVVGSVARAGGLDYARERAQRLGQQADAELDLLSPSPARDALRASITYVLDRHS